VDKQRDMQCRWTKRRLSAHCRCGWMQNSVSGRDGVLLPDAVASGSSFVVVRDMELRPVWKPGLFACLKREGILRSTAHGCSLMPGL
jgi:hypothetical protein